MLRCGGDDRTGKITSREVGKDMKIERKRRVGQEVNREGGMREEDSENEDENRWRHKRCKLQKVLGT